MPTTRRLLFWSLVIGLVCGGHGATSVTSATPVVSAKTVPAFQTKTWAAAQAWLKSQPDQLVVVAIWTTTCGTCRDSFPEIIKLQQQFAKQPVLVIGLNCDYDGIKDKPPEFYRPQVAAFLKQQSAPVPQILLATPFVDFLEEIDLSSTPAICLYERGKLLHRFDNDAAQSTAEEFTHTQVAERIANWVTKRAAPAPVTNSREPQP